MPTYLITHTCPNGCNIACAQVTASRETKAVQKFEDLYPQRRVSATGRLGKDDTK